MEPASTAASLAAVARAFELPEHDAGALYVGMVGSAEPLAQFPARIPFTSTVCRQVHFSLDQYRYWTKAMRERPLFHRKQWEFVYIAQALFERRMLAPGRRGLAFGVGKEPLPALVRLARLRDRGDRPEPRWRRPGGLGAQQRAQRRPFRPQRPRHLPRRKHFAQPRQSLKNST